MKVGDHVIVIAQSSSLYGQRGKICEVPWEGKTPEARGRTLVGVFLAGMRMAFATSELRKVEAA